MVDNRKELEHLPKDSTGKFKKTFVANGKKYFIRDADDGIGILRYSQLLKYTSVLNYGSSLSQQRQNWIDLSNLLNEFVRGNNNMNQIFELIKNQTDGIIKDSSRNYDLIYSICSLFIFSEDEKIDEINQSIQDDKIGDWNAAFHERDFFFLLMELLPGFLRTSNR